MENLLEEIRALVLLVAANAAPVVAAQLARTRQSAPLDFGYVMPDGERLFGSHKTWRGLACGVLACIAVGTLFGLPAWIGGGFAVTSLVADATSSFAKRRMHLKPGTEYVGLDQIGEALLPLVLFARPLSLEWTGIAGVVAAFIVLDVATARLRHRCWRR
jgi:CDP-diglyceride synthetase